MDQHTMNTPLPARQAACLFQNGNRAGLATQFKRGHSGNPLGRPPKIATCLHRLRQNNATPADLYLVLDDDAARKTEKLAAHRCLVRFCMGHNFAPVDLIETHRIYRGWYNARRIHLERMLINRHASPEHREAARRRLVAWRS